MGPVIAGQLQQYLPFTVLKLSDSIADTKTFNAVATVLTVYGIETLLRRIHCRGHNCRVATVLTVYGIETYK